MTRWRRYSEQRRKGHTRSNAHQSRILRMTRFPRRTKPARSEVSRVFLAVVDDFSDLVKRTRGIISLCIFFDIVY